MARSTITIAVPTDLRLLLIQYRMNHPDFNLSAHVTTYLKALVIETSPEDEHIEILEKKVIEAKEDLTKATLSFSSMQSQLDNLRNKAVEDKKKASKDKKKKEELMIKEAAMKLEVFKDMEDHMEEGKIL